MRNGGSERGKAQSIIECKRDTKIELAVIVITVHIDVKSFIIENPSDIIFFSSEIKGVRTDDGELLGIIYVVPI